MGEEVVMKGRYFLYCLMLSTILVLSGCDKNEASQDKIPGDLSLTYDSYTEETTTYTENMIDEQMDEQTDEQLIVQPNDQNGEQEDGKPHFQNEQPIEQDVENKSSDILNGSMEGTYFLSTKSDFFETLANNPIDQQYVIDEEANPLQIWQSALEKGNVWNQQIDFSVSKLENMLDSADFDQMKGAINLWHEYYQEEVEQNRELYGSNGMILGSMYTATSADVLMEKCRLTSFILLSLEYEMSGQVSYADATAMGNAGKEYSLLPQNFCVEYSSDFEENLTSYSINQIQNDELEKLIQETANKIEEKFGHDFTRHAEKYVSVIQALYTVENDISQDDRLSLAIKENRLKLYAVELLNIRYMLDAQ